MKEELAEIIIHEPKGFYLDLEDELEDKFKIFRAVIVETESYYNLTK